jgi:hypothetical protein
MAWYLNACGDWVNAMILPQKQKTNNKMKCPLIFMMLVLVISKNDDTV